MRAKVCLQLLPPKFVIFSTPIVPRFALVSVVIMLLSQLSRTYSLYHSRVPKTVAVRVVTTIKWDMGVQRRQSDDILDIQRNSAWLA